VTEAETARERVQSAIDGPIWAEDFESFETGDVPPKFVLAGSEDQGVVADPARQGSRSYRMSGSHGGCWRALARRPVEVRDAVTVSGWFRRGGGEVGCHDGLSGTLLFRTSGESSWSDGSAVTLLQFRPDGSVASNGSVVGEYVPGEWTSFEVEYVRDRDTGTVTCNCRVDGADPVSTTRDEAPHEDDLSAIELRSDDFTVFWDDLVIEPIDASPEPTTGTVIGEVLDEDGKVANASVEFADDRTGDIVATATTDSNGAYSVEVPGDASYDTTADADGYKPDTLPVEVHEGETSTIDYLLQRRDDGSDPEPEDPPESDPEDPGSEVPYDLENAEHSRTVSVSSAEGGTQYVLWGIPDADPSRRAVVTTDYEPVAPEVAKDALLTDVWTDARTANWSDVVDQARKEREAWMILETLSRAGTVSAEVAAALALAQVNPAAALQHKIGALDSAITWGKDAVTDPHREQFSKMAESAGTLRWARDEYGAAVSSADLADDALEVVDFALEAYGAVDDLTDVAAAGHVVASVARTSGSVATGLSAGGAVAKSIFFQMYPAIATSYAVDAGTRLLEANARTAAAGVAHNTVRLSVLRELDDLHEQATAGIIDPPDIVRYHVEMMAQYQIAAAATSAMAEYQDSVDGTLLGGMLSEVFGSEDVAETARETSQRYANLARHSIAQLGAGWRLGGRRFEASINRELVDGDGGSK